MKFQVSRRHPEGRATPTTGTRATWVPLWSRLLLPGPFPSPLGALDAPTAPHQEAACTPSGSLRTDHPSRCSSKILNPISPSQGVPTRFLRSPRALRPFPVHPTLFLLLPSQAMDATTASPILSVLCLLCRPSLLPHVYETPPCATVWQVLVLW